MKCYECKYEHSDCRGNHENDCPNFAKKCAVNYPQKIRELEKEINGLELQLNLGGELCEVFRNEINRLKATLKQADEAYDIQGKQLLEALDEIEELKAYKHESISTSKEVIGYRLIRNYIEKCGGETDGEVIAHIEGIIEALEGCKE